MTYARVLAGLALGLLASQATFAATSVCFGTPQQGRLAQGVSLPLSGDNFAAYGLAPVLAGRTHMHETVRDTLLAAFASLHASHPDVRLVYAETGWKEGGPFRPHKTHQNGLSVDLMVPVRTADGRSVPMPTGLFNRYGYDMEFDHRGRADDLHIDFNALAALILALDQAARDQGIAVRRVIFAPDLQPQLYAAPDGRRVKSRVRIPTKPSWVRHDEHIHVDFAVPCQPLSQ